MTLSNFKKCIKSGCKSVFRNGFMSFASVGTIMVCLFVLGISFIILRNLQVAASELDDNLSVVVFMKEGISEDETQALIDKIKIRPEVKQYRYVSAEEAWKEFCEEMNAGGIFGDDIAEYANDNPLANSANIDITLAHAKDQDSLLEYLSMLQEIRKINYSSDISQMLSSVVNLVTIVGITLIALLSLVAVILISNTIRMTVFMRRDEIRLMKFIGAADGLVNLPFVVEGILIGLLGAIIPALVIYFGYDWLVGLFNDRFASLSGMFNFLSVTDIMKQLLPIYLVLGVFLGMVSSLISINKYLRA